MSAIWLAVIFILLIAVIPIIDRARGVDHTVKAWLFVEHYPEEDREAAVISAKDPHIRKRKNGTYTYVASNYGNRNKIKYYLKTGTIEKLIGRTMLPEEPAAPVDVRKFDDLKAKEFIEGRGAQGNISVGNMTVTQGCLFFLIIIGIIGLACVITVAVQFIPDSFYSTILGERLFLWRDSLTEDWRKAFSFIGKACLWGGMVITLLGYLGRHSIRKLNEYQSGERSMDKLSITSKANVQNVKPEDINRQSKRGGIEILVGIGLLILSVLFNGLS